MVMRIKVDIKRPCYVATSYDQATLQSRSRCGTRLASQDVDEMFLFSKGGCSSNLSPGPDAGFCRRISSAKQVDYSNVGKCSSCSYEMQFMPIPYGAFR